MTSFAKYILTQRRCDCGETARFEYPVLILGKPDVLYLCAVCLIHELEMQLQHAERRYGRPAAPLDNNEAAAVIRRYIKLEQGNLRNTPRQRDANIDQARRVLSSLRDLELSVRS